MNYLKKITNAAVIVTMLFSVHVAFAQAPAKNTSGLIPCGISSTPGAMVDATQQCTFDDLIILAQNVINFLIFNIASPLAAVMFAYAGFLYVTNAGNESRVNEAKGIFWAVFWGFVIVLAAWLTVNMIVTFFLNPSYNLLGSP